jgi:hypothetical protein
MPYKSQAQRAKFHADPKLRKYAKEWDCVNLLGTRQIEAFDTLRAEVRKQVLAEKRHDQSRTMTGDRAWLGFNFNFIVDESIPTGMAVVIDAAGTMHILGHNE